MADHKAEATRAIAILNLACEYLVDGEQARLGLQTGDRRG